jgi:hypothetical protein
MRKEALWVSLLALMAPAGIVLVPARGGAG